VSILIVEDDLPLWQALLLSLTRAGHPAQWLRCLRNARAALSTHCYAAIVLDVELPDGLGYDLLASLRSRDDFTPVLFLTVRDSLNERVQALDGGADDYLTKPFAVDELISRLRAVIRRTVGQRSSIWELGPIRVDIARREASVDGRPCELTPAECALLLQLVQGGGSVVSRVVLEQSLFRSPEKIESNVLEVHIHSLRRKLGGDLIQTVRGVGYRVRARELG
jgi:DNA-binding response OmpR family regulator